MGEATEPRLGPSCDQQKTHSMFSGGLLNYKSIGGDVRKNTTVVFIASTCKSKLKFSEMSSSIMHRGKTTCSHLGGM